MDERRFMEERFDPGRQQPAPVACRGSAGRRRHSRRVSWDDLKLYGTMAIAVPVPIYYVLEVRAGRDRTR